jgi:outer membrane lipoprotein LolB
MAEQCSDSARASTVMRTLTWLMAICLLASCAQKRPDVNHADLWPPPADGQSFSLTGKMSFSDGDQGGSGQVEWQNKGSTVSVTLKAPLSKRSWQLTEYPDHATLRYHDGSMDYAEQTDSLLDAQMGWDVPWEALKLWVRGEHTLTGSKQNTEDDEWVINDQGWRIVYSRFKTTPAGQRFPSRIFARKDPYSIKLVIRQWLW